MRLFFGKFLKFVQKRTLLLVQDVVIDGALVALSNDCSVGSSASPWVTASCCVDGSSAVIQPLWFTKLPRSSSMLERETAHAGAYPSSNASTCLGDTAAQLTLRNQPLMAAFMLISLVTVRTSGVEKERSCPTADATSPLLVCRDRSIRNWSVHQDRSPRWVNLHGPALASMGHQALAPAQGCGSGSADRECRLLCSSKHVQHSHGFSGTQRHDHAPNTSQRSQHQSGARGSELCKKFKNTTGRWQRWHEAVTWPWTCCASKCTNWKGDVTVWVLNEPVC